MIEPANTGISYSFTADGFYEEAYYRAVGNRTLASLLPRRHSKLTARPASRPTCPQGIMQFQHGSYTKAPNSSLLLTPIAVDGRQLKSDPCSSDQARLTRYAQFELFQRYEIINDPYHKVLRLNLFKEDGALMQPMYLVTNQPQILPTITMNPTNVPSGQAKVTGKVKRDGGEEALEVPLNRNAIKKRSALEDINLDAWWYFGVGVTALGGILFWNF